jgi:DinB family protein
VTAMERPDATEYAPFYAGYVALVPESDALSVLAAQPAELLALAAKVPAEREQHRYAPGKWSVREVFGHLTDGERVFGYRAFCISRGDQASLPGFDEQSYIAGASYDRVPLGDLAADFAALRRSNLAVMRRLQAADWARSGTANGTPVTVRALAFVMAGHVRHHLGVLRGRYGVQ